jgi:hypothetical protein
MYDFRIQRYINFLIYSSADVGGYEAEAYSNVQPAPAAILVVAVGFSRRNGWRCRFLGDDGAHDICPVPLMPRMFSLDSFR